MLATFITFWQGHPWAYCFASGALGGFCVCYGLNLKCPSQGHVQSACSLGVGWGMESLGGGNWLSKQGKVGNRGRGFEGYYQVPGSSCLQLLGSPQQQQPLSHTSAVMRHEVHLLKMYTMTWIQRGVTTSHGNDIMTGYLSAEKIMCALSFSLLR